VSLNSEAYPSLFGVPATDLGSTAPSLSPPATPTCHSTYPERYPHLLLQVLALVSLKSAADPSLSGVPATYLGSTAPAGHSQAVYSDLAQSTPLTKLLYVTPEQLMHNERLREALSLLHQRNMLARIVIDEVRGG
jgi:hypothetical protein